MTVAQWQVDAARRAQTKIVILISVTFHNFSCQNDNY